MPVKQEEVMWPRQVANKVLRKTIGSNNFVADFPSSGTEDLLEIQGLDDDQQHLKSNTIFNHPKDTHKYKVFVSTWNVGGVAPSPEDLNMIMEDWLDTCNTSCDIYVLGFQEVVPLKAGNVLGCENKKNSMKWNSLIREALNGQNKDDSDKKDMQNLPCIPPQFHCVISKQMVGIFISVWVRSRLRPFVRYPSVSCVGCGIMGCLGNKGSVSVRFRLHETSFCFVCTHLASGGRQGDERNRNANTMEIWSRTSFPKGRSSLGLPRKILDHDRVIFLGDLNYRISLPEETTRLLADKKNWTALLENDQLTMELMDGQVFGGWHEGIIKFAPTYKYNPSSDVYYGSVVGEKKAEKRRAPAWCDRIIWYGKGLKQHIYTRGESKLSDHRPVKAIFSAEVEVIRAPKGLQNVFLSNRFEQMTSQFEVSFEDDQFLSQPRSSFQI